MKAAMLLSMFGAASFLFCANINADEWNQKLTLTFNNPVEIPGQVLPAGTYVFKVGVGDTSQDEDVVRVYDKAENHVYGVFLTIPDHRLTRSNKPVLEFEKGPAGSPEAIYAWFYPDDKTGHEFVYPKSQAMRLAKANDRPVAAMPDDATARADSMKGGHVTAVTPDGREVETVTVFGAGH